MEHWKTIEWAPNYQVSNLGRVKQLGRIFERRNPKHPQFSQVINIKPRLLNGWVQMRKEKPICKIVTLRVNGQNKTCRIHQLILSTFIGPCPPGLEGCHNNGDPLDNRLDNLRWDTHQNNMADTKAHGTYSPPPIHLGELHPNSKLKIEDVKYIRSIKEWPRGLQRQVAKNLGVVDMTISRIRLGQGWNHIETD